MQPWLTRAERLPAFVRLRFQSDTEPLFHSLFDNLQVTQSNLFTMPVPSVNFAATTHCHAAAAHQSQSPSSSTSLFLVVLSSPHLVLLAYSLEPVYTSLSCPPSAETGVIALLRLLGLLSGLECRESGESVRNSPATPRLRHPKCAVVCQNTASSALSERAAIHHIVLIDAAICGLLLGERRMLDPYRLYCRWKGLDDEKEAGWQSEMI